MDGFAAWQKLFRKYNPRTMARGLRMLTEAINPPKAKHSKTSKQPLRSERRK